MKKKKKGLECYRKSEDVVARDIQGELIIVPVCSSGAKDEIFTCNESGRAIWEKIDGKKSVAMIVEELAREFSVSSVTIERDMRGFIKELLKRKMLVLSR